jgi:murein DD-endopeptidase
VRAGAALAVSIACLAGTASAQGIDAKVGRFYQEDGWTLYRLGISRPLSGPLGTSFHGDYMERVGGADGRFAGVGFDVTAFRGAGPYLVAGLAAGMGSPRSSAFSSTWTSWSAGAGYELVPASFVRFGVEGRWREMSLDQRKGLELAAGLSFSLGGGRKSHPQPPARAGTTGAGDAPLLTATLPATPRIATTAAALADSVIATATEAMGRPYKYGGTGTDGDGFDCSGLIQYAYGRHGITLPRTSAEQAHQGRAVKKNVAKLAPGDLLTFSNRGGRVTHVGLYIGDGRFIHSATRGVQVSVLSAEDPYGRWWYMRWVGVRRIVE